MSSPGGAANSLSRTGTARRETLLEISRGRLRVDLAFHLASGRLYLGNTSLWKIQQANLERHGLIGARTFDDLVSRAMSKASKRAADCTKVLRRMRLSELRQSTGYSQKKLAAKLKMKQSGLSKLENARDVQVMTLQKIVGTFGGELEIVCKFLKGEVRLVQRL